MKRKGFTSGERMIASEHDCHTAKWSGRAAGNFWCQTCGHKFVVGDGYRWIYANGNSPSAGNFMVCAYPVMILMEIQDILEVQSLVEMMI